MEAPIKQLIRNTKKPVPKTKASKDTQPHAIVIAPCTNVNSKTNKVAKRNCTLKESDINKQSVKSSRNRSNVDKATNCGSSSLLQANKISQEYSSMVTRAVNFPQSKTVFKNLIPLSEEKVVKVVNYTKSSEDHLSYQQDNIPEQPTININGMDRQYSYWTRIQPNDRLKTEKHFRGDKDYKQYSYWLNNVY